MDQKRKYCPNCYNPVEIGSDECSRCFTKISHNLENFLLAKYKIFTLIGVFGALSIYLLTTSNQNNNDSLLLSGSLFCLTIVIILSGICIWDLSVYSIKNEKIDFQNLTIWDIFRSVKPLPSIILFAAFFAALIFILVLYVLSNNAANYTIISAVLLTAIAIVAISIVYYPYRYFIERWNNWIRAVIFIVLLSALFSFIKTQITTLSYNLINVSLTAIISLIIIVLLAKCLVLMYRNLTSAKQVTSIDTTTVKSERKNDDLTVEDHTEPQPKESVRELNGWSLRDKKILYAIALIIFGLVLNFIFILVCGNQVSLFLPFGYGIYFLGLTLIVNSWFSQKEDFDSLNSKIEELSMKIEDMKKR